MNRLLFAVFMFFILAGSARAEEAPVAEPLPHRVLRKEVDVKASAADCFRMWTSPELLPNFLGEKAAVELRPGGKFEIYFSMEAPEGSRGAEGCTISNFTPNRALSFTWNAPPAIPKLREAQARTQVTVCFDGHSKGTRVTLAQAGFGEGEDWEAYYKYFDRAWGFVMEGFKTYADAQAQPAKHWTYFLHPAKMPFLENATEEEKAAFKGHGEYLTRLAKEGVVLMAGPCFDPSFPSAVKPLEMPTPGLVIFKAADEAEAQKIMNDDPAVKAGIFLAKVAPFRLSLASI